MEYKLLTGFASMSELKLRELAGAIKVALVGNPYFTSLSPMIDEFLKKHHDYNESIPMRDARSSVTIGAKNKNKKALIIVMKKLAYSIMVIAEGDQGVLQSSGFHLNKSTGKRMLPEIPKHVEAFATGDPDTVMASCIADRNTSIYKARISVDEEDWRWGNEKTTSKLHVQDLPRGVILYVQMAAKNSAGESQWSNSARIRLPLKGEPELKRVRKGDVRT